MHTSVENSLEIIRGVLSEEGNYAVVLKQCDNGDLKSIITLVQEAIFVELRQIMIDEYDAVKDFVLEVFMQFEAPDYGPQGIETFKQTGIDGVHFIPMKRIRQN